MSLALQTAFVTGTACAGFSTTPQVNKVASNRTAESEEAAPPFCSPPGWMKGRDRTSHCIHLLCCAVGSHRQARNAQMAVFEHAVLQILCCSPVHCTPPLQLVTNGRELRDRIPPSFAFIKRSPRKCDFFFPCEHRYQKLMKSELSHCCVHFLLSLPLGLIFLSLSQATTDSHKCYGREDSTGRLRLCTSAFFPPYLHQQL